MEWTNGKRKLSELIPWDKNPRQLTETQAKHLTESIRKFGQVIPYSISLDNEIYDGHQRQHVMGMMEKYGTDAEVDVRISSRKLTEEERKEFVIRLHENTGEWDFDKLANEYDFESLKDWGMDEGLMDFLDFGDDEPEEDPGAQIDKAEELREKWQVESGQLWQLGEHKVICGDCTDEAVVERLMGGERADMVWGDPPYGKGGYAGRSGKHEGVTGDDAPDDQIVLFYKQGIATEVYLCCDWETYHHLLAARGKPRSLIVWAKQVFGMGRGYRRQHEFIGYYGSFDSTTESDLWEINRGGNYSHPTEKPVALPERAINNSSKQGDIVYDPFLGSGTTLIACERLGRKCRGVEIEPKYVAVTLERWHEMTGLEPVLVE